MVMPMDLWRASSVSFLAPAGRSVKQPRERELRQDEHSDEPVQSWARAPQRRMVLRIAMRASLCA